ncbi:sn-glycerol-1-phosphate dehydrogenase [Breznakiella homolactica]|uniref:sn-glycerol-1-phosphate dehydrogenase n=1 Tax=Breznakiella homolactica TaxID=2798577 RepID=A0A7T8BC65_9SPIR|nr:sn-glycerol-1-phosphate dehydrogenase [Breznakiella homolactica]QQO09903.1 sn-glycerol-1-phosphate dehydrogenase [Breznakiella homolactica]
MQISDVMQQKLDTKFFIEKPNCLDSVTEILPKINTRNLPVLLVYDENTRRVAGNRVRELLIASGIPGSDMLLQPDVSGIVTPDYGRVLELIKTITEKDAFPVSVGSGTINDVVKRAAFETNRPYLCIPTASSIDGYSSFGASLVQDGYKTTLGCPPPAAIIADTDILMTAPYAMTASGYGDLYSKYTAGIDWVLADRLGIEPINQQVWDLVQTDLPQWLSSPEKLKSADPSAFAGLFRGLTMSGFAMQLYKDSRPASGTEHLISHIWEMDHLSRDGLPVSHGFKVSAGIVMATRLMEAFYSYPLDRISIDDVIRRRESWEDRSASVRSLFPDPRIQTMVEGVCKTKWADDKQLALRLEKLISVIPDMKRHLEARLESSKKVIEDLQKAGCPTSFRDFGLTRENARETVAKAQMIRTRYIVLDAIYETGLLPELLEEIF